MRRFLVLANMEGGAQLLLKALRAVVGSCGGLASAILQCNAPYLGLMRCGAVWSIRENPSFCFLFLALLFHVKSHRTSHKET